MVEQLHQALFINPFNLLLKQVAAEDEEEAEKHRKELQMIRDILKSREETKDEDNEDTEKEENDK